MAMTVRLCCLPCFGI